MSQPPIRLSRIFGPFYFNGQKDRGEHDFTKIPNGAPGIETRMSLLYTGGCARETLISAVTHHSCADYSAYEGIRVKGMPDIVVSRGKIIVQGGNFVGTPGAGQFMKRSPHSRISDS